MGYSRLWIHIIFRDLQVISDGARISWHGHPQLQWLACTGTRWWAVVILIHLVYGTLKPSDSLNAYDKGDALYRYFGKHHANIGGKQRTHDVSRIASVPFFMWLVVTALRFVITFYRFTRVRNIAKNDYEIRHVSVHPSAWNNSAPTGWIFMKFYIWTSFENLSRKFKFHSNVTSITGTLHEDQYTFSIISRSVLLRMTEMFQTKVVEKIKAHILC